MRSKKIVLRLMVLCGLLACALPSEAITIGADAIDRASNDTYNNFSMLLLDVEVPTGFGDITGWETYVKGTGQMALLFLEPAGGNDYVAKIVDERTVAAGYNSFASSGMLEAGWIMGIWMGNAKVDFDYRTPDDTTYTDNNALPSAPTVGDTVSYTGTITPRTYSINATINPVPEAGGSAILLLLGCAGLLHARKRSAI